MDYMTRNQQAGSNIKTKWQTQPANFSTQFYEQLYTSAGSQEWISMPDAGQSKVVISFPLGVGAAFLEGTCSPPDLYSTVTSGTSPIGSTSPVTYVLQDTVTENTAIVIWGDAAIRINNVGGTPVGISVRC
jgi:hypothetical protein